MNKVIIKKQADDLFLEAQKKGITSFNIFMSYIFGYIKNKITEEDINSMREYLKEI